MRIALAGILALLFNLELIAGINVEINNKSIKITVERPETGVYSSGGDSLNHLQILNTIFASKNYLRGLNIDELRIPAAVPEELYNSPDMNKFMKVSFSEKKEISPDFSDCFSDYPLEEFCRLEKYGSMRGIKTAVVVLNPFTYEPNSKKAYIFNKVVIEITLPVIVPVSDNYAGKDAFMFANLANPGHVESLGKTRNAIKKGLPKPQSGDYWYNPDKEYLRIITTKDGIASVKADDMIKANGNFLGKSSNKLVMLHRGAEVPIFFLNDTDGILNSGDEIIFEGSHAAGDTLWFDHYTSEEPYFIYYDSDASPVRFNEFPKAENAVKNIEYVEIDRHIEYNKTHFWGFELHDPENVDTEGWYWKENNSSWDNKFIDSSLFLVPYNSQPVELNMRTASMKINDGISRHKINLSINNKQLSEKEYPLKQRHSIDVNPGTETLIAGYNKVQVTNMPYINSQWQAKEPNSITIDYYNIKGKALPVSDSGLIEFRVNDLKEPGKLDIKNFRDKSIVIIDKKNNYYSSNPKIRTGINIVAGANSYNGYSSLVLNHNRITGSGKTGFHISVLKSPAFTDFEYKFFEAGSTDLQGYLSSLPDGSLVAALYNNTTKAPPDKISLFNTYGSSQIAAAGPDSPWYYAFTKNSNGFKSEKAGMNGTLSESVFYETNSGGSYNAEIALNPLQAYQFIASDRKSVEQAKVFPVAKTNLRDTKNGADLIVIYHNKFKRLADSLVALRTMTHPDYKIKAVEIQDVYNEFYNGRKSAHAIKEFLSYAYFNWQEKPVFLTLIGDASYDPLKILPISINEDYVPTWGSPHSDYWYSLLDGDDYIPELIVGRIPVNNDEESFNYFDKLKSYEFAPLNLWMKKFLFLSGGDDLGEKEELYSMVQYIGESLTKTDLFTNRELCMDTAYVRKHDITIVGESDADMILKEINNGVGWVFYYGHGSQRVFDMDGWTVDIFNNKNRYGLLSTLSCNTGSFASSDVKTRTEDYIFQANAGFVGASGATATGRTEVINEYFFKLSNLIKNPAHKYRTFGELVHLAKVGMDPSQNLIRQHMLEYLFVGDPMVKLKIPFESEVYTYASDLSVKNKYENNIIVESDSFAFVKGIVKNQSMYKLDVPVKVKLTHTYNNNSEVHFYSVPELCKFDYYDYKLNIKDKPGIHFITVTLDPEMELDDPDRNNNTITASFEVFNQNLLPIEPMAYWDMKTENPVFRIINPLDNGRDSLFSYEFKIVADSSSGSVQTQSAENILIHENYIEWKPKTVLMDGKNYYLFARSVESSTGYKSSWLEVPFWANKDFTIEKTVLALNSVNLKKNTILPDNFIFENGINSRLVIPYKDHSYSVLGVSGTRGPGSDGAMRSQEMVYDGNRFLYTPPPLLGMNIALVSEKDYKVRYYPWWNWDMWYDWNEDPKTMNRSIDFVQFLRDSVKDDDYLFLATCEQAFFLPVAHNEYHTIGSLDTIKAELKKFGSNLADSLWLGCSYAMVGKRGMKNANDAFDIFRSDSCQYCGDTAKVTGNIREKFLAGSYTTPVFGNSDKWFNLKISGYFPADSSKLKISIYGIAKGGSSSEELLTDSVSVIDLSKIDAEKYPKIYAIITLQRMFRDAEPYIIEIRAEFVPSPEPAIIRSSLYTNTGEIMRGETIEISGFTENISLRSPSANTPFTVNVVSDNGDNIDILSKKANIEISGLYKYEFSKETDFYRQKNNLKFVVNENDSINEQYSFNNFASSVFYLYEDSLKPYVVVYFDGDTLNDGDYVSSKPKVEIKLFDNSKLQVKKTEDLKVLVNSDFNKIFNLPDYKFVSMPKEDTPLKAIVSFTLDTIEYRHNIISVWFSDASGNRDSTDIYFYYSINGFIENANNSPNPISREANFNFYYKGPSQGALGRVIIYNLNGQKVRELGGTVSIGNNSIPWDGLDNFGNDMPSGAYFYVIFVDTDVWVEQVTGKFIVVH